MTELSFRPQWLLSSSSEGYFLASGWMLVDKTPKLGTQLISGHPRATLQGALAPWEAASMVHVGTSHRAPLLSSTWWLTPSSPGCSPYGQGVWATLLWVSVHVLPLFPRPCFCKASSPEETHHWSSDLPMEVTSSIESEYPELEEIHQEHWVQIPCSSMLGNHYSPRTVQGKHFNAIHSNSRWAAGQHCAATLVSRQKEQTQPVLGHSALVCVIFRVGMKGHQRYCVNRAQTR